MIERRTENKKLPTKYYGSVEELPENLQEVVLTTDVLYQADGMPYRKYIKHHSFGTYPGREGDYDFESVAVCVEAPMVKKESQTIASLNGKINSNLWREIDKRNRESSKKYKVEKRKWKKSKGLK